MFRPIASGLSPNTTIMDVFIALRAILSSKYWKDPLQLHLLKNWFTERYSSDQIYLFNAGRSALYFLLQAAGIKKGDEVIVQAFTCIGAISPIVWIGAKPVYVDIDRNTYNLDPRLIEESITSQTKAVIVQHTFGIPADIHKIKQTCRRYKIILIEDCAVSMGAKSGAREVGTFGDAAFFSFGRDKVVSSVSGGVALINSPKLFVGADRLYSHISDLSLSWVRKQLLHPVAMLVIIPLYRIQLGKALLVLLQKLKLITKAYDQTEYLAIKPDTYPKRYPSVLVPLILNQLKNLDSMNNKRRLIASRYGPILNGAIYLRYPVVVNNRKKLLTNARKQGIILGRWYSNVIDPEAINIRKFRYKKGTCPVAEDVAKHIVNLPTYPRLTSSEVKRVVKIIHE